MCRFTAYLGHDPIILNDLLKKPDNSLIKQSYEAKNGKRGLNADGFGLAWYNFAIDQSPGVFKSILPAWNDKNLQHLSAKIQSPCFLAHVRASTVSGVHQNNCHPFIFEQYAMVHNGTIRNFKQYKKRWVDYLDEDLFLKIKGNTDSEYFFFLILHHLRREKELKTAIITSLQWVKDLQANDDTFSRINIAMTDGKTVIATRYASKGERNLDLHYLTKTGQHPHILLSSEPLFDDPNWHTVPENHMIQVNLLDMNPKLEPIH